MRSKTQNARSNGTQYAIRFCITLCALIPIILAITPSIRVSAAQASLAPASDIPTALADANLRAEDPNCASPANPIVAENCQSGTEDWKLKKSIGDIEGFAWPTSLVVGDTLKFFVKTSASRFTISVYRLGYYAGTGGRLVTTINDVAGQTQPTCQSDVQTGLLSCGNWSASASLTIPKDWVSGIFIGKLTRTDTGGDAYVLFTLRDDQRKAAILYQQSLFTFQAYNVYGGKSVYTFNSTGCPTISTTPRAVKISFARPYIEGDMANYNVENAGNNFFRAEYPMVRWLEQQGYDVSYSTTLDTHRSGKTGAHNALLDHHVFISVGHDEYWTQEMRNAITAARDGEVQLGFFSGNTAYWRVRLESDPWTGEPDSIMVVYKTTENGPSDPSGQPTGTWRDPQGVNDPENGLLGTQYDGDNNKVYIPLRITADRTKDKLYRHTDLQTMPSKTYIDLGDQVIGWEWDSVVQNGHSPNGIQILSDTPVYGMLLQDAGNASNGNVGIGSAQITRYIAPSGATVFSAGTILWAWGLGAQGITPIEPDKYIQQITYNAFADLGAQPATPVSDIVLDGETGTVSGGKFTPLDSLHDPVISNIQSTVKGNSVTIAWQTDVDTIGQVWSGARSGYIIDDLPYDKQYGRDHSSTVTLPFDATTYFKIVATSRDWRSTISPQSSVTIGSESSSFLGRIRDTISIRSRLTSIKCFATLNPTTAAEIGVAGVIGLVIVGLGVTRGVLSIRRRRAKRASAPTS